MNLSSVYRYCALFWRRRCIGNKWEKSENKSFWSAPFRCNFWLFLFIFPPSISGVWLFCLPHLLDDISTCYVISFIITRKLAGNGLIDSKGSSTRVVCLVLANHICMGKSVLWKTHFQNFRKKNAMKNFVDFHSPWGPCRQLHAAGPV